MKPPVLIALVEDEPLIHDLLRSELEEAGYSIELAADGKSAIAMMERKAEELRALVTDIKLPGDITGWDIAQRARELNPAIAVIYMSGDSADDWAAYGVPKSVMVPKPFAGQQVSVAVAQLLNVTG